jgi:alkanesulfonate monooxygenase SsuD/methylene tetrahydromethanopterin reductase-like flavin-dependent oxidoreductase (luciferase family)
MCAILEEVDYDFSQFTMEGFRCWLEQRRGRRIEFVPWTPRSTLSGAWLAATNGCDYVFYDEDTPAIYQAHVQLHEMAHMICGHPAVEIGFLNQADADTIESLLLRSVHPAETDLEAEMLASLIQERVLRHGRLQELLKAISSDGGFAADVGAYVQAVKNYT